MSNSILHSFDVHGNHNPMCQQCEIERLRDKVNRLLDREITDDQIDAAWMWAAWTESNIEKADRRQVLLKIGIVECPECHAVGWIKHDTGNPQDNEEVRCPTCNTHGWVREGH